jgi:hypothetical protein
MSAARPRPARCKVKGCPTATGPCAFHEGSATVWPRGFAELDRLVRERPHRPSAADRVQEAA